MSQGDFVQRGLLLVERGQFQEAVKTCRLGLLGRPGAIDGRIVLGRALLALGRYDEVLVEMRLAIDAMPSYALAHMLRGEALLGKGDLGAARSSLRLAAGLAPGDPEIVGKARNAEFATAPSRPHEPPADATGTITGVASGGPGAGGGTGATATNTTHYRRAAGSDPGILEDDLGDDSPTSILGAAAEPPTLNGYLPDHGHPAEPATTLRPDERPDERPDLSNGWEYDEGSTSIHVAESAYVAGSDYVSDDVETSMRVPLRAAGTPVYGDAQARSPVLPRSADSAERRGPGEETLLTLPLSLHENPVHSTGNGRTSHVANKKITEPLNDDALVEVPSGPGGNASFGAGGSGGAGKPPPRLPNSPSRPPGRIPPIHPQPPRPSAPMPAPRVTAPPMPAARVTAPPMPVRPARPSAPPPLPGPPMSSPLPNLQPPPRSQPLPSPQSIPPPRSQPLPSPQSIPPPRSQQQPPPLGPPQQPPPLGPPPRSQPFSSPAAQQQQPPNNGGNWQRPPAAPAQAATMMAGVPAAPAQAATMMAAQPPPGAVQLGQMGQQMGQQQAAQQQPSEGPLGAQRAGAFQAYQTAIAAAPPNAAQLGRTMALPDSVPVAAVPSPMRASKASKAVKPTKPRKRRTALATALWVLVGAAVIGGGVFAGFQIRDLRLRRQIDAAEKRATESSASDTWIGWRTARDGLASIAAARRTAESRAVLARAQAVLAYELGEGAAEASATLRPLGADARTASARAYMALISGDPAAAAREVEMISGEPAPSVDYLRGRVALLGSDAKAAIAALEKSHRADPRPFTTVALAEAYATVDRWDDAKAALDAGLTKAPDHPALVIARAQIADRLGKHTAATSAEDLTRLERLVAEGAKPASAQPRVSRWQAAMALLVAADLQLRRGERPAALASIGRSLDLDIDEQRLAEATVTALVAADLSDVAVAGAKRGLGFWPQSMVLRTALAQGSFADGRLSEVIEALPDALIGKDPLALAIRARARIAAGDLESARRDLDTATAATSPELTVARSLLKLASGEQLPAQPAGAAGPTRPDLALVAATAARMRGEPAAAVALLEPLVRMPLGAERTTIRLELARAYRDVANYPGARAAYAELSAGKNPAVRLEAAQLLLEDRDPKGAREHIEALLRDVGDKVTGAALVEAMRIRTLTGGAVAAEALADKAFKAGAPPWMLQREAARIAIRRGDLAGALTAVTKALDGSKADIDTLYLACDLVEGAPEAFVAKVTKAVDERLTGLPDQLIAQGKLAIGRGDRDKATELFGKAAQEFMKKPASARRVAQASFGVGALAASRGDWVSAKLKLETALELDPSLVDAYLYQAEALASSGSLKQAITRLKVASEYNPEALVVWQLLESRASEAGDKKTAGDAAKRVAELQGKKPS